MPDYPSIRISARSMPVTAAAWGTVPYLAINLGQVLLHDGSFIHFSKLQVVIAVTIFAFALWVGTAAVLVVCAAAAGENMWLLGLSAVATFAAIGTAVEPTFWLRFFDVLNGGFAEWIFRVGSLSTFLAIILARGATSKVRAR